MAIGTPVFSALLERPAETSTNVTLPATVNAGDFLFIFGSVTNATLVTAIGGVWTTEVSIDRTGSTTPNLFFAWTIAVGGEAGTTVAVGHTNNISLWGAGAIPGVDNSTPFDIATVTTNNSAGTSCSITGGTTVTAGAFSIFIAAQNATTNTSTPPTGYTEQYDKSAQTRSATLAYQAGLSTGAQGTVANTWSGTAVSIGALITLRPASAGPTPITLSDTGSGVDAASVAGAVVPLAESGAGTDAAAVAAAVPVSDTGAGLDAVAVAPAVPLADTGHGTDALTITVTAPLSDAGSGADALTVAATVPLSDVGAAADAINVNAGATPVTLTDTAAGVDALTITVTLALAELGAGTDSAVVAAALALTDTGSAVDTTGESAAVPLTDTGHGADTLAANAAVPLTDTGAGVDAFTAIVAASLADLAHATDAINVINVGAVNPGVLGTFDPSAATQQATHLPRPSQHATSAAASTLASVAAPAPSLQASGG